MTRDLWIVTVLLVLWAALVAGLLVVFWALTTGAPQETRNRSLEALGGCVERARKYEPGGGMTPAARAGTSRGVHSSAAPRN